MPGLKKRINSKRRRNESFENKMAELMMENEKKRKEFIGNLEEKYAKK